MPLLPGVDHYFVGQKLCYEKKTCQNLSKLVKTLRYPHRMMQQTGEDSAILKEGYLIKKVINATIVLKG